MKSLTLLALVAAICITDVFGLTGYVIDPKRNVCWFKGGRKGGKNEATCGKGGYCCRKNWKDCPAELNKLAPGNHHTCVVALEGCRSAVAVNPNRNKCWFNGKGGQNKFCGAGNYCCRKGWKDCPSWINVVAPGNHHTCIKVSYAACKGHKLSKSVTTTTRVVTTKIVVVKKGDEQENEQSEQPDQESDEADVPEEETEVAEADVPEDETEDAKADVPEEETEEETDDAETDVPEEETEVAEADVPEDETEDAKADVPVEETEEANDEDPEEPEAADAEADVPEEETADAEADVPEEENEEANDEEPEEPEATEDEE